MQAGLFAGVLTSFLIDSLQNLQPDPAQQAVYYHQQSVAMLAQISQQIASIAPQVSIPSTPPPPYPAFHPSISDIRVNAYWLIGLVCSLSAALFATLVQQWVRSYMQIFQRYDHPLKRARFRQFFFEGARSMRAMAVAVPSLIRASLVLFFFGLCDHLFGFNTIIGVITIIPICCSGSFFLYGMLAPLWKLQSPHQTLFSRPIFFLMQKLRQTNFGNRTLSEKPTARSMEACQERMVMEETDERKDRDVRAIQWLIDSTAVNAETEPLVLAIPGSFNTEWGRDVWREASSQARDTLEPPPDPSRSSSQVSLMHHPPHPLEGAAGDTISRCVRYLFETCNDHSHFENEAARRRRMRACVEATASLVCCIDFRLQGFGEVGKLVSEIGHIEKVNELQTNQSYSTFTVHWTCLSLMEIQQKLSSNRLQGLAGYAVTGLACLQSSESGSPDDAAYKSVRRIDECLRTAWEPIEELHRAFEPWGQTKTKEQVEEILRKHESQISALERTKLEVDGMGDIDWRISLLQGSIDDATHRLTRLVPGMSFSELKRSGPLLISEIFNFPFIYSTPITPQLIFPIQHIRSLSALSSKLRDILEGRSTEGDGEVLECLGSVDKVRVPLRQAHGLMTRQLWRLLDLRDGGGLGFTTEVFFLFLRQLLSASSSQESNRVFYTGTLRNIVSRWRESRASLGTQYILLNIVCDLVVQGRGVFSDFPYPEYITTMLLETVGDMLCGHMGSDSHIIDALREVENVEPKNCFDVGLQRKAVKTISQSRSSRILWRVSDTTDPIR